MSIWKEIDTKIKGFLDLVGANALSYVKFDEGLE